MKIILLFSLILALSGLRTSYSQEVFKLNINQPPPLIVNAYGSMDATVGERINLDTLFVVEGDVYYSREWKFWDGLLLESVNDPVFTLTCNGVFYLTVVDANSCTAFDSVSVTIATGIMPVFYDRDPGTVDVFPNPNTGSFDFVISDCQPGYSIEIINSLGIIVLNMPLDCNNDEYSSTITMLSGKPGIFLLLIKHNGEIVYRQKVVVLNH
ncbi:MAG: T9SS type A sorting domain-containing protein [Bacteroidales bacterium]|nr:T9SS type A sorting domain-containing protein [Bacteroidales bacterium]